MRIKYIDCSAVVVLPTDDAFYRPEDRHGDWHLRPKWIVEVHSNDGLVGLGESHRGVSGKVIEASGKQLLGVDPLTLNLHKLPLTRDGAYDVYEMALYDLVGKSLDRPAYQLLGGGFRDKVSVHYWLGKRNPQESAQIALKGKQKGFKGIKIKCGNDEPTVSRLEAISSAVGPEFALLLDANGGFQTPERVLELADQFERFNVIALEDPVPKEDMNLYVLLREQLQIPLALHLHTLDDVVKAVKYEACDYVNIGDMGMAGFVLAADVAWAAGLPSWHGSAQELGIRDASFLHACAAAEGCTLPSDTVHFLWTDDLLSEPLRIENGEAYLPDCPGLGVTLDRDAVARYSVNRVRICP